MSLANSLKWSARRLRVPVDRDALVLEVGSGGNPYPRANVLLDAYEESRERHWAPLVADRPTVLAFGEKLPFRDKAFDFVIAAHVLEHSSAPEQFLGELQRVARGGYIETPDAFMERINPYRDHRLEVTMRNDALIIRKKAEWVVDTELVELYEERAKALITRQVIPQTPETFHVRYFWKDRIAFEVVNPDTDATWPGGGAERPADLAGGAAAKVRDLTLRGLRAAFSQGRRNRSLDILPLLRCPRCQDDRLSREQGGIRCGNCASQYDEREGIVVMTSPSTVVGA